MELKGWPHSSERGHRGGYAAQAEWRNARRIHDQRRAERNRIVDEAIRSLMEHAFSKTEDAEDR